MTSLWTLYKVSPGMFFFFFFSGGVLLNMAVEGGALYFFTPTKCMYIDCLHLNYTDLTVYMDHGILLMPTLFSLITNNNQVSDFQAVGIPCMTGNYVLQHQKNCYWNAKYHALVSSAYPNKLIKQINTNSFLTNIPVFVFTNYNCQLFLCQCT